MAYNVNISKVGYTFVWIAILIIVGDDKAINLCFCVLQVSHLVLYIYTSMEHRLFFQLRNKLLPSEIYAWHHKFYGDSVNAQFSSAIVL